MHRAILVITGDGPDLYEQLELYDENLEIEPYTYEVKDYEVERFLEFYLEPIDGTMPSYSREELYEAAALLYRRKGRDWNRNAWEFDLTTYTVIATSEVNPNGRWDWYEIGGRYDGLLRTKEGQDVSNCKVQDLDLTGILYSPNFIELCYASGVLVDSIWLDYDDYPHFDEYPAYAKLASTTKNWAGFVITVLKANQDKEVTVVDIHF